jgi:hypothetical protein
VRVSIVFLNSLVVSLDFLLPIDGFLKNVLEVSLGCRSGTEKFYINPLYFY